MTPPQVRTVAFLVFLALEILAYEVWCVWRGETHAMITCVCRAWQQHWNGAAVVVGLLLVYLWFHLFFERL